MSGITAFFKKIFILFNFRDSEGDALTQKFELAVDKLDSLEFIEKYDLRKAQSSEVKETIPTLTIKKIDRYQGRFIAKVTLPQLPPGNDTNKKVDKKDKSYEV